MRNRIGQTRIPVRLSYRLETIEGFGDGPVADGMNVNEQPLFICSNRDLREIARVEQEFAVPSRLPIWLGKDRGLRRIFHHAVRKHLDSDNLDAGNMIELFPPP